MLFNSVHFVFFLPVVIVLYYLVPNRARLYLLLAASYYFYMVWNVEYVLLILCSTVIDYFAALEMDKHKTRKNKRIFLVLSLLVNLLLLGTFKYFNFFSGSLQWFTDQLSPGWDMPVLDLLLPVGISFYTFQTLSYTIDVYRGNQKAEKDFGYFALYVSFFPQLVAGPIERFNRLAPQFKLKHKFEYENFVKGLRLILYGLFIKMVVADNLAVYVDSVYSDPGLFSRIDIGLAWIFYSFQIYGDFYGYSLIAIGSALMLGIRIMDNFKAPYLSRSISEFWQRWHISLSSWFKDYLYVSTGGNRVNTRKWIFNIIIVFLVSGLWHGANWTFVFWGAIFAFFYLFEKLFPSLFNWKSFKPFSFYHIIASALIFTLVTIAWVFFRSQSIPEAFELIRLFFINNSSGYNLGVDPVVWSVLLIFIASDLILYNTRFDIFLDKVHISVRWIIYIVLIFSILIYSAVEYIPFIYFQF